ncbi:hypothetical protein ABIB40_000374 [Pedobacter sp. UYP30]|uniref:WbqC family protein n=1 Tax=Pedobacter sp. UYP30 TaxID=1756400 RepID=UPI00339AADAB
MQNTAILPLFYLPPVGYFSTINKEDHQILIEKQENFPKQTYRNRACIYSPNGKLDITVPIVKGAKNHVTVKDVRISYDFSWQRLHWLSLQSCYRSSAYFEYYEDEFSKFYHQKFDFLFDYNLELFNWVCKKIKLKRDFELTSTYLEPEEVQVDYRKLMSPKQPFAFDANPYYQVFEDRHQFIPNLSIVDLLFNQGPQTSSYL